MIGNAISEEPQERPLEPETQEADLPAVRMSRQHEVPVPGGQVAKRAWIVEEHDAQRPGRSRVLEASALEAGPPLTVREI